MLFIYQKFLKISKIRVLVLFVSTIFLMCDLSNSDEEVDSSFSATDSVNISFTANGPVFSTDGNYGSVGGVNTHWAVWIEDSNNNYIKTLRINKSTPQIGKYGTDKLSSLPYWQASSKFTTPADTTGLLDTNKIYKEFDGLTSASLDFSKATDTTVNISWDFTDGTGEKVSNGIYRFCVELSALVKNIASIKDTVVKPDPIKIDAITATTAKDIWIDSGYIYDSTAFIHTYTKDSYDRHYLAYGIDSTLFTDTLPIPNFPRTAICTLSNLIPNTTYYFFFRGELISNPDKEYHSVMGEFKTTESEIAIKDTTYEESGYPSQYTYGTIEYTGGTITGGIPTTNIKSLTATKISE